MKSKAYVVTMSLVAVAFACSSSSGSGGGSGLPSPASSLPSSSSNGSSSNDSGAPLPGVAYPLKLSALSTPLTSTANITVFFSVIDAKGAPVADLERSKFFFSEDGQAVSLDAAEYDFQVKPLRDNNVSIPTVLVLDLSKSVVEARALEIVKSTASSIIDSLLPQQSLAILSFADAVTVRSQLTNDKMALKAAVSAITKEDGVSTNLYGAVKQALGMWTDSFSGTSTTGRLTSGLAIVISDGDDTAAATTLEELKTTRDKKRIITIGVGSANASKLQEISSTGFHVQSTFEDLGKSVGELTSKIADLNRSIYLASYCSPKRAGEHDVLFSVTGNGEVTSSASCRWAQFSSANCNPGYPAFCGGSTCCPAEAPYHCDGFNTCFRSPDEAAKYCNDCVHCGGTGQPNQMSVEDGPSIRIHFAATGYQSLQCPKFYEPECKSLDTACCPSLPGILRGRCNEQLAQAMGQEGSCLATKNQYCGESGPACLELRKCCATFGDQALQSCWAKTGFGFGGSASSSGSSPDDPGCTAYSGKYCAGIGSNCSALRTCCAGKAEPARSQCETRYFSARDSGDETQRENACMTARLVECP